LALQCLTGEKDQEDVDGDGGVTNDRMLRFEPCSFFPGVSDPFVCFTRDSYADDGREVEGRERGCAQLGRVIGKREGRAIMLAMHQCTSLLGNIYLVNVTSNMSCWEVSGFGRGAVLLDEDDARRPTGKVCICTIDLCNSYPPTPEEEEELEEQAEKAKLLKNAAPANALRKLFMVVAFGIANTMMTMIEL